MEQKVKAMREEIRSLDKVAVAFSGGVDSSYLLKEAYDILGGQVLAVLVKFEAVPKREQKEAEAFCERYQIPLKIVKISCREIPHFTENPKDRCYYCKKRIFEKIIETAQKAGISYVLEGSNVDDTCDYRPGHRAIEELHIQSPLRNAGLGKEEIRKLSQNKNLPTASKSSFACLASRFPYGEEITKERLRQVERAEDFLYIHGFRQFRVRIHRDLARIEILPEDFLRLSVPSFRCELVSQFKAYGFSYVTLDLQGYRTGSMNETLQNREGA